MHKLKGIIISDKMQKTVVVRVDRLKKHPRYLKYYKSSKKYKAHDEKNESRIGDIVFIGETRPLSKEKRWRVIERIRKAADGMNAGQNTVDSGEDKS